MEHKVHYWVQKCPSTDPVLSHINPVCTLSRSFYKIRFNTILHLRLGFQIGRFPYRFPFRMF
jgi:hypothetical protein